MTVGRVGFRVAYDAALRRHLAEPTEETLRAAYELGRDAVSEGTSVLELAAVHHDALATALERDSDEPARVTRAAADFHLESLSAFEMVQRGFREAKEAARLERRQAALLRQLSSLLADASLAFDASGSLEEMLRLVAEQARELTDAGRARATAVVRGRTLEVVCEGEPDDGPVEAPSAPLVADLTALDGRRLGSIEIADPLQGAFRDVDDALVVHLAQMASAAIERAGHYR